MSKIEIKKNMRGNTLVHKLNPISPLEKHFQNMCCNYLLMGGSYILLFRTVLIKNDPSSADGFPYFFEDFWHQLIVYPLELTISKILRNQRLQYTSFREK